MFFDINAIIIIHLNGSYVQEVHSKRVFAGVNEDFDLSICSSVINHGRKVSKQIQQVIFDVLEVIMDSCSKVVVFY